MNAVLRYKSLRTIVCETYLSRFRNLFADEVRVTPDICEAVANHFSWEGAAFRLLSDGLQASYERRTTALQGRLYSRYIQTVPFPGEQYRHALKVGTARLFAELFNDKANAGKRAALRRLARKK